MALFKRLGEYDGDIALRTDWRVIRCICINYTTQVMSIADIRTVGGGNTIEAAADRVWEQMVQFCAAGAMGSRFVGVAAFFGLILGVLCVGSAGVRHSAT